MSSAEADRGGGIEDDCRTALLTGASPPERVIAAHVSLRLYDTGTRSVRGFEPIDPPKVVVQGRIHDHRHDASTAVVRIDNGVVAFPPGAIVLVDDRGYHGSIQDRAIASRHGVVTDLELAGQIRCRAFIQITFISLLHVRFVFGSWCSPHLPPSDRRPSVRTRPAAALTSREHRQ